MTLDFYKYTGAENVINKRSALQSAASVTVTSDKIEGAQDLENPTLYVRASENIISGYNYVYIREWQRYYFVQRSQWVGDGIYLITLREDYLNSWSVKAGAAGYGGIAKYSGLGDGNLPDPRIAFNPESSLSSFELFYANTNAVPLQDWYCVKFMSTNPYEIAPPAIVPTHYIINIAIMNENSYKQFVTSYRALGETERTAIARMILSVNRVKYIAPDPTALSDYRVASLEFASPFDYQGVKIDVATGSTSEYECYIISHPDVVQDIFNRRVTVVNNGTTTAHTFNASGNFWELKAQHILKMPELQPVNFNPAVFGKKSSYTIYFDIGYEPYSETYVIKFYPDETGGGNQAPVVQKCQISIPFLADTSLDFYEQKSMTNTLAMASGFMGGVGGFIGGLATGNVSGAMQSLTGAIAAPINFDMEQKRMAAQEFSGMGVTTSLGGSPDWIRGGMQVPADGRFYLITQTPVATFWANLGKPDGHLRSFMALAGTGYAEIELINPPALSGASYNELDQFASLCRQGVIF